MGLYDMQNTPVVKININCPLVVNKNVIYLKMNNLIRIRVNTGKMLTAFQHVYKQLSTC